MISIKIDQKNTAILLMTSSNSKSIFPPEVDVSTGDFKDAKCQVDLMLCICKPDLFWMGQSSGEC